MTHGLSLYEHILHELAKKTSHFLGYILDNVSDVIHICGTNNYRGYSNLSHAVERHPKMILGLDTGPSEIE
jgi:hypothetical protein